MTDEQIKTGEYAGMFDVNPNTHDPFTGKALCLKKHPRWAGIRCMKPKGHDPREDHVNCGDRWDNKDRYCEPHGTEFYRRLLTDSRKGIE